MLRTVKARNARSKRAMDARLPKEVEDERTTVFVKGTHTGEVLNAAMKDLMALKRPHAISFSKKNEIHPFDSNTSSLSSLEFWSGKNDASMVLDMLEVGVLNYQSMESFKTPKSTPGHKPLMHFASELFDTHPRFIQLKSILMNFFNGEVVESIHLKGLDHVISISLAPTPPSLNSADPDSSTELPTVHLRVYTTRFMASGSRIPRIELTPMGPFMDFVMRRHQDADSEMWKQAMKQPKLKKQDVEKGLGKKHKNMEVDEMGDLRGRVHIAKQDLGKLQQRKMKGAQSWS
ncbi:Brix domain-containing protein [Flagelloscypha sp. PMI_526]|nr:Brix domain-containing protein [Flagelloscypha sp. PMI_526]